MQILGIDHVQLAMPAGEEDKARRFYTGLLGIPEVPKPSALAERGGAWFQQGPVKIHLGVEANFRPALKAHPALLVRDLAALVRRLSEAGVRVIDDDGLPGYNRVYVSDPFGNRLELMEEQTFDIEKASQAAAEFEKALTPIGKRPVDLNLFKDPEWGSKLSTRPALLDEVGMRAEGDALVASLLDAYAAGDDGQRASIRKLFAKYPMFAWAACISEPASTASGFRRHLLLFSAMNGGRDIRDTIVGVDQICAIATEAGVNIAPVLAEVEALSSDATIHGFTSLQEIMKRARVRFSEGGLTT